MDMNEFICFLQALKAGKFSVDDFFKLSTKDRKAAIAVFVGEINTRLKPCVADDETVVLKRGAVPSRKVFDSEASYTTSALIVSELKARFDMSVPPSMVDNVIPITVPQGRVMHITYLQPAGDDLYVWRRATLTEMLVYHLTFGQDKQHKTSFIGALHTGGSRPTCYALKKRPKYWMIDLVSTVGNTLPTLWVRSEIYRH